MPILHRATTGHPAALVFARGIRGGRRAPMAVAPSRLASSLAGRRPPRRGLRILGLLSVAAASGAAAWWAYPRFVDAEPVQAAAVAGRDAQPELEQRPGPQAGASKEESRSQLSSQHAQVRHSWEHPGVYAWGDNSGRVVAPQSSEPVVKLPRRLPFFDGRLLRDLKLDRRFGVAVTEVGDVVQWGAGFSGDPGPGPAAAQLPVTTLAGRDIVKVALSSDRIVALSAAGHVYSLPVARADQLQAARASPPLASSSWRIPFWSAGPAAVSYRRLEPAGLAWGEKVVDVSGGLEHCLFLTSAGRVFAAASSTEAFPSCGQLGVAGLTWATRPDGAYDRPHEITALAGRRIVQIAAGDRHSLVRDAHGRVFAFGDNSAGQLGFPVDPERPSVDVPSPLPVHKLYAGTGRTPVVTSIAAGGSTSFFAVSATADDKTAAPAADVADAFACGLGLYGGLGTGKWTHVSSGAAKIKALSGLYEYDEAAGHAVPIGLARLSVGATHAAAVLANATHLDVARRGRAASDADTNWGADVLFWGGNQFYQLGTGKRNNLNEPTYIAPLDDADATDEPRNRAPATSGARTGGLGVEPPERIQNDSQRRRLQITPRKTVRLGPGRTGRRASVEQRVECGRYVTAVYSGT